LCCIKSHKLHWAWQASGSSQVHGCRNTNGLGLAQDGGFIEEGLINRYNMKKIPGVAHHVFHVSLEDYFICQTRSCSD
jgi:hypothetical protein